METIINSKERRVEVCISPQLFPIYFQNKDCVVVVIDIFRASSAICTALNFGVKSIIPVDSVEKAKDFKSKGFVTAAERHGEIVNGFDLGNSPFSYLNSDFIGKDIVLTTTNGTKALEEAKEAKSIIIGSFLNLNAVCDYLTDSKKDVILLCAGWKGRFNMEDTLFAGAVVSILKKNPMFCGLSDSSLAAACLYDEAKKDLNAFLKDSSHRKRLAKLNLEKDIEYCLQIDTMNIVPKFNGYGLEI